MIVAIFVWRVVLVYGFHASITRTYISTDTRLDSIAWGCLLSVMIDRKHAFLARLSSRPALILSGVVMLLTFAVRRDNFRKLFATACKARR